MKNSHTRGINLHEAISEPLVCKANNFLLNKGSGGDAYDENNDKVIEIKVTSNFDLEALEQNGYFVKHKVMNSADYGNIPQNRERIYVIAFKNETVYHNFDFPQPKQLTTLLKDLVQYNEKVDSKYYYTADKCKFYDELKENVIHSDTTYQWRRVYVRENKSNLCPTLTANMGTGGHNVPIIKAKHGIRKLTPRECFNLQGYPENYILPEQMSNTRLYKQAGNSVVVPVVELIALNIKKALSMSKKTKRAV